VDQIVGSNIVSDRGHGEILISEWIVIPTEAGIQFSTHWIPACAGMTNSSSYHRQISTDRQHQ
jgi:hypothetical protein